MIRTLLLGLLILLSLTGCSRAASRGTIGGSAYSQPTVPQVGVPADEAEADELAGLQGDELPEDVKSSLPSQMLAMLESSRNGSTIPLPAEGSASATPAPPLLGKLTVLPVFQGDDPRPIYFHVFFIFNGAIQQLFGHRQGDTYVWTQHVPPQTGPYYDLVAASTRDGSDIQIFALRSNGMVEQIFHNSGGWQSGHMLSQFTGAPAINALIRAQTGPGYHAVIGLRTGGPGNADDELILWQYFAFVGKWTVARTPAHR